MDIVYDIRRDFMKYINSKKKLIGIIFFAVFLIGIAGFLFYVSDYYHADDTALAALNSTSSYTVINTDDSITFTPTGKKSTTGVIFYPGGKVQAESYSVIASKIATNGYNTMIVKMPFNLAFFGANKADDIIANHSEITSWVIMGHSFGGVFASDYARRSIGGDDTPSVVCPANFFPGM
jgi:hypothetical protein